MGGDWINGLGLWRDLGNEDLYEERNVVEEKGML